MVSSVGEEAGATQPNQPLSEQLARRLLHFEAGDHLNPEELIALVALVYARLRTHLALFLGEQGFDALWRRAIHLVQPQFHQWNDATGKESITLPPGLHKTVFGGDAAEAHARLVAAFTSFIALLFTFVGEDLGVRLIDQAWPHLSHDAVDVHTEGATQ